MCPAELVWSSNRRDGECGSQLDELGPYTGLEAIDMRQTDEKKGYPFEGLDTGIKYVTRAKKLRASQANVEGVQDVCVLA